MNAKTHPERMVSKEEFDSVLNLSQYIQHVLVKIEGFSGVAAYY